MNRYKIHYIAGQHRQKIASKDMFFHEAGHAAAICVNNKDINTSPASFQIILNTKYNELENKMSQSDMIDEECIARIKGGRLVQSLLPLQEITEDYLQAFETDIVNLLAGPLAEAKYVHLCDDEIFNERLVNFNSLNYYGGRCDLALVNEYLNSLYSNKNQSHNNQREEKLHQLFLKAFDFVQHQDNWNTITHLANCFYESKKDIIEFQEVVSLIESEESIKRSLPDFYTNETKLAVNY